MKKDPLFQAAAEHVLKLEGGFVDDPSDPGGATNRGISLRFLRQQEVHLADVDGDGDVDADDIKSLSKDQALDLYRQAFWDRYGYGVLPPQVAIKTFDLSVNMGPRQAHLCLQRALKACRYLVTEDGIMGQQTIGAAQGANQHALLAALKSEAAGFYRVLVITKPSLAKFKTGWLRRAYA